MNCADIKIIGGPGNHITGEQPYIANLPGYPEYQPLSHDGPPSNSEIKAYPVSVA